MPDEASPEMTAILRFMEVRPPAAVDSRSRNRNYIHDNHLGPLGESSSAIVDTNLFSAESPSEIGKLVYKEVFCNSTQPNALLRFVGLLHAVLGLIPAYYPVCSNDLPNGTKPLNLTELERRAYVRWPDNDQGKYYLLPDSVEYWDRFPFQNQLVALLRLLEKNRAHPDLPKLKTDVEKLFGGKPLYDVVFHARRYTTDFAQAKRTLFDTLYLLYVLRRVAKIDLGNVIQGLRALHILEALAIDRFLEHLRTVRNPAPADVALWDTLKSLYPALKSWDFVSPVEGFPLIATKADFNAYLDAVPVIHPIFARLFFYRKPFNDIKPIGIGDLKVVKKWLLGYEAGEIAHIDNVLKGEEKERIHRRLEKTEEMFSFSSEQEQESTKDTQTTDRFEMKREIDSIVNTTLSVNANAGVNWTSPNAAAETYGRIVASVSGGVAYSRNSTDQEKTSNNFAREVVDKALQRVQNRVTQNRSTTKLFETEETNKHTFSNIPGQKHISGIYRWVDKKYKARLFNYGKRMMFEFIIPEPAAFFVESRLKAFEANLTLPTRPSFPNLNSVDQLMPVRSHYAINNPAVFNNLRTQYDLEEFTYPQPTREIAFIDQATGQSYFEGKGLLNDTLVSNNYTCKIDAKQYQLAGVVLNGQIIFQGKPGDGDAGPDFLTKNALTLFMDGFEVFYDERSNEYFWTYRNTTQNSAGPLITGDTTSLTIAINDGKSYLLTIKGLFTRTDAGLEDWQVKVYKKIWDSVKKDVDARNKEKQLAYDTAMATYRNRMAELKAQAVHELIQGQSEAFNQGIILTELKKHCLTLLTKEFDSDTSNDFLTNRDATSSKDVTFKYPKPVLHEDDTPPSFSFEPGEKPSKYPTIKLDEARNKGRHIQFLEQAFDWRQLAYIFYPYFWSAAPDWITLMNRSDDTDPTFSAFLQAGSVRVLLAVTPAYDEATLHYLATREPWEGGPAPVIGDPLFLPLYEEIRKQQDDLYGATPDPDVPSWEFTMPTSLVYLQDSSSELPKFPDAATP